MKSSRYNYFINNGENTIVFNGITEKFFEIKSENADIYKQLIKNPDSYGDEVSFFLNKLNRDGFVLDNDRDEKDIAEKKLTGQLAENLCHLMVMPTYQCNLRCWYCVQDHQDLWMTEEIVDRIKRRIDLKMSDPSIEGLHLSWFGGEPLMAYDIIVGLTRYAREAAVSRNKSFSCVITTNGTLLNAERILKLKECGVSSYQITIDGKRSYHNSVKVMPNEDSFAITMKNIDLIARHTRCSLRFNYTSENLSPEEIIQDVDSFISDDNKGNISFLLYKVWQENEDTINSGDVISLFNRSIETGIRPELPRPGICYSDQTHYDCIFPDGKVEKCDNESPSAARGVLKETGEIEWPGGAPSSHMTAFRQKDSECSECIYLPLCGGPCVAKRKNMLDRHGHVVCQYDNKRRQMEGMIKNIVRNNYAASRLKVNF